MTIHLKMLLTSSTASYYFPLYVELIIFSQKNKIYPSFHLVTAKLVTVLEDL